LLNLQKNTISLKNVILFTMSESECQIIRINTAKTSVSKAFPYPTINKL